MTFLNLHFPDKNLEALFREDLDHSKLEKYLEILILCGFILISFNETTGIIMTIGFFCFTTLLLHFPTLLKISFRSCLAIGLGMSLLYSLTSPLIKRTFDVNSQGWPLPCLELMLANQATNLEHKIVILMISLSLKFATRGEGFAGEIILENMLYEVLLIYIFYCFEKGQRSLFKKQYETQKELTQLKNALQKLISPCIAVVDWKGEKSLFQNKAFDVLLESFENGDSNPFLAFQRFFQSNDGICLNDFLREVQTCKFSDTEAFFLSGSCKVKDQLLYFDLTLTPILWDNLPSILIALENVTYKKELSELQMAQEDKDMLIATVSHELRTPLNGVLGLIQIVEPKIKEPETLEYLSLCRDNANLLSNLVNSLLDNQQIQHGKIKLLPSKVHLDTLIKNVLGLFSFQASQKNVKLSAFIEDDVPSEIITDDNRLKQVLINLVSNALKFTSCGSITINISLQSQDHLRFSVSDTGRGIKKDDLDKIFKMYTKLEDKEGLNKHGVGLGLTISNSIAKLLANHQDGITVESQYGSGSTFSFLVHKSLNQVLFFQKTHSLVVIKEYLSNQSVENLQDFEEFSKPMDLKSKLSLYTSTPHSSSPKDSHFLGISSIQRENIVSLDQGILPMSYFTQATPSKIIKPVSRLDNSKGLVLVVDDNYFNIMIAKNLLESLGYQVQTALSGEEAIQKFEDSTHKGLSFLCVFMDCQMPIMDGFETTRLLKRVMETLKIESVPIIALTASYDEKTVQACYKSGMDQYLCKPLIKDDLLKALCQIERQK